MNTKNNVSIEKAKNNKTSNCNSYSCIDTVDDVSSKYYGQSKDHNWQMRNPMREGTVKLVPRSNRTEFKWGSVRSMCSRSRSM